MKRALCVVIALAAAGLVACSKGTSVPSGSETSGPTTPPTNLTNFPLYQGSTVVDSKRFTQNIRSGQASTGVLANGAGTYNGDEVVAGTTASLADLENWLRQQEKQPPSGYVAVAMPQNLATLHSIAMKAGMDFAMFHDSSNSKHGLLVVAMDPKTAHQRLGPALSLISKYQGLPQMMREGIDSQLKQRYGYTASEFVEPGSPLGSAVGAMNDFNNSNQRAIVIIDATKQ